MQASQVAASQPPHYAKGNKNSGSMERGFMNLPSTGPSRTDSWKSATIGNELFSSETQNRCLE